MKEKGIQAREKKVKLKVQYMYEDEMFVAGLRGNKSEAQ